VVAVDPDMTQPIWKTLWCTDCELVQEDTTGEYEPEMEVADQTSEEEEHDCTNPDCPKLLDDDAEHMDGPCDYSYKPAMFQVFRFTLERHKIVEEESETDGEEPTRYLVPMGYEPSPDRSPSNHVPWFVKDLGKVANSCGIKRWEMVEWLCSESVQDRAQVYSCIGGYHGFMNLDTYPLEMTEAELNARWNR
jgi:hypothetical protein